jgi:hypothetical protein
LLTFEATLCSSDSHQQNASSHPHT